MDERIFPDWIFGLVLRRAATLILAFSWILGIGAGYFLFYATSDCSSLMGGCMQTPVSIVSFFLTCFFPFLSSALAVFLSSPWLLPMICFGKAFLFSYVFSLLSFAGGASAVFSRWMILIGDIFTIPLLYCFCLRYISGMRRISPLVFGSFLLLALGVSVAIWVWILPFWTDVLNF